MKRLLAGLLAGAVLGCLPATAHAWDESGYWDFADKVSRRLDDSWNAELGRYRPGSPSVDTMMNANLLLLHSVAGTPRLIASIMNSEVWNCSWRSTSWGRTVARTAR